MEKILIIVGPTSSGKSALAVALAQTFNGEIVSADSRQVYRGLDIGSGKITKEEMRGIPHHMLDIADPMTTYTASDFVRDADNVIADILRRKKLPILVGGSFFYIDALLGRIHPAPVPPNQKLREELSKKSIDELSTHLYTLDPIRHAHIDTQNKVRLIRAIEIATKLGAVPPNPSTTPRYNACILGIQIDKETLHSNIHRRLIERLKLGMLEEAETLHANGLSFERMEMLGLEYRYLARYLQGLYSYDTMVQELEMKSRQYAKRQMTWLKRNTEIVWFAPDNVHDIKQGVLRFLDE